MRFEVVLGCRVRRQNFPTFHLDQDQSDGVPRVVRKAERFIMAKLSHSKSTAAPATHDDLLRLVGDVDEQMALDILALHPTIAEVEEAALWAAGDGDVLAKAGHQLSANAAEILNILASGEEEEPPPVR
jgi:hypothetical protein